MFLFILALKGKFTDPAFCLGLKTDTSYHVIDTVLVQPSFQDTTLVQSLNQTEKTKEKKEGLFSRKPVWFLPNIDFEKPVILIYILTIVILYSVLSIIFLLIFMIINRGKRDKENLVINELKERYQSALVNYLEQNVKNKSLLRQIRKIANSNFTRKILIDEMIDLSVNLPKEKAEVLRTLYFDLGLNNDSLLKLDSKKWHIRIKGFKECAFMNIEESIPIIEKRLNCKNDIERSEAQLALVRLNIDDPYSFLDNLKRPFSIWEQNIVHQEITYHNLSIPKFERWCYSDNNTIKRFSAKMIQLFEQKGSWDKLVELLEDEDEKTRASAIISLGNLNIKKTQSYLREHYQHEIDDNKLLIINALTKFKNINNLVFFKHIIEIEEKNVWLQVEAAKGIREIGIEGKNELTNLLDSEEYRNYQIVIKHVLDDRL